MAEVKWIKIVTDIFDDDKILLIENLPDADAIIVIWFKLLCLAGKQNNSGVFLLNNRIAYTEKMLSTIFRRKETTVQLALKTFEEFGMIEIVDNVITIPNWGKYQTLDQLEKKTEYMREYMREYRKKQKEIACKTNDKSNSKANVSCVDKIKIREEEEKIRKDKSRINNTSAQNYTSEQIPVAADVEPIILNNGEEWHPTYEQLEEYIRLYPGISVFDEFRKMRAWCISNPQKRKTKNGVKRFVGGWLSRAQDESTSRKTQSGNTFNGKKTGDRQREALDIFAAKGKEDIIDVEARVVEEEGGFFV